MRPRWHPGGRAFGRGRPHGGAGQSRRKPGTIFHQGGRMIRILTLAWLVWLEMIRGKDNYVLLILLAAFLVTLMAFNLFGLGQAVPYLKEIGLLLAWVCSWILAVSVSARQLPQEERQGTIFPQIAICSGWARPSVI